MKYERSRYTLAEPWDRARGILVNTLSGAIDIAPLSVVQLVKNSPRLEAGAVRSGGVEYTLVDRGYYVESRAVERQVARWLSDRVKQEALRRNPPKYVLCLTLQCNLSCKYCWQVRERGADRNRTTLMTDEMVDAAFSCIDSDLERRQRSAKGATVSLFGGEPLMDRPPNHRLVAKIGEHCRKRNMQLHFTTNGKDLAAFRGEIAEYHPSIQVTVDGANCSSKGICLLRAGQPLEGVYDMLGDLAADGAGKIMLRFLVTPETIADFVALADRVFRDRRFSTNFTLGVAPVQDKARSAFRPVWSKSAVLEALVPRLQDRPYSHRIVYLDWRSLALFDGVRSPTGVSPFPHFYYCEANVDLVCFDHEGHVYACYESAGDPRLAVGAYWPKVVVNERRLSEFRARSAFSIKKCAACALSPICGGGCQVRGYKRCGTYARGFCDDLRAETGYVMRNWPKVSRMLLAGDHRGRATPKDSSNG